MATPYLQVNTAQLAGCLDAYITQRLFNAPFNPIVDENWRVLLLQAVIDHITKVIALALHEAEQRPQLGNSEVYYRYLSEQLSSPNVKRKQKVAVIWCDRINQLPANERSGLDWHYVLLGERVFYEWREKRASLSALCDYARIRPQALPNLQVRLE